MSEQPGRDQGDPAAPADVSPDPASHAAQGPDHASGPVYGRVTRFGTPGVPAPAPRRPVPGPRPPWPPPPPVAAPWTPSAPPLPVAAGAPVPGWPGPSGPAPSWPAPHPGWAVAARPRPRWRREQYAPWGRRVLGDLVDHAPAYAAAVLQLASYVPLYAGLLRGDVSAEPRWGLLLAALALSLASVGWNVYNRWICGGRTGQSLGKRLTGIRLLSRVDGRPIGTLNAFLRDLLHVLDDFAWVGYLWPLWDEERQTFADKIADTVVVRVGEEHPAGWA